MPPVRSNVMRKFSHRLLWWAGPLLALPLFSSCRTVEFYEMEAFTDSVMNDSEDATELHFHQKIFYSMEGSAGGIGSSAGGGCGCY